MKYSKIFLSTLCGALMMSCSDDFLQNPPQGSLSDAVMNSTESVDLLVNAAYAGMSGMLRDYGDPTFRPTSNWPYGEVRSDNAYKGGGGEGDVVEFDQMEKFDNKADNWRMDEKWFSFYCQISRCNSALRVLNAATEEEIPVKKQRIAEMKVLRSHFYFELVRFFNKIPYQDENLPNDQYINVPNDEFTRDQHLARIAAEFLEAAQDLPYVQDEVGRVNKNVALAYAAKAKLYQAYEQDPATNKVVNINQSLLNEVVSLIDQVQGRSLLPDFQMLDKVEYDNGSESIFEIQYSQNDGSSAAGRINWSNQLCSPGGGSPYGGDGFFVPSQDLINAYQTDDNGLPVFDYQSLPDYGVVLTDTVFELDDNGKFVLDDKGEPTIKEINFIGLQNITPNVDPRLDYVVGRPTITWKTYTEEPCGFWVRNIGTYGYNCQKRFLVSPNDSHFTMVGCWGLSDLNWRIIRYADLLLYKAEALIELGRQSEAMDLINQVRQRAIDSEWVKDFDDNTKDAANYKIGLYPTGVSQDYARQALRTEMRLEKALEGERFFDLVRWGIAQETMNNYLRREEDTRIYYKGKTFTDGYEYFPIPFPQYSFSQGLYTQNPGYPAF